MTELEIKIKEVMAVLDEQINGLSDGDNRKKILIAMEVINTTKNTADIFRNGMDGEAIEMLRNEHKRFLAKVMMIKSGFVSGGVSQE